MGKIKFKLCLFGDGGVGKTTLTRRFLTRVFDEDLKMTIGADFSVKELEIEGKTIVLRIWDFAGEDRFRVLLPSFAKGADGAIFMFDITKYSSMKNIDDWLSFFQQGASKKQLNIPIIMVGGKLDLDEKRSILAEDAIEISKSHNLHGYIECSSKTGDNVDEVFESITRKMMENANVI
ncbi:MAG: Rab family GTPase [Promethearchaeota archaeon]